MKKLFLVILVFSFFNSSAQVYDYEGNKYDTVRIGNHVWLKQNVHSRFYTDGKPVISSYFACNNNPSLVKQYGYLYTYHALVNDSSGKIVNPVRGICPKNFHVATYFELDKLIYLAGGKHIAPYSYTGGGNNLKDSLLWNGTDSTGFSLLPAGSFNCFTGFLGYGDEAKIWSSDGVAWHFISNGNIGNRTEWDENKVHAYSCRCVMDDVTGIKPADSRVMFEVYPNPATNILYINFPKSLEKATLFFYNSFGQMVHACKINKVLDLSNFPAGFYIIAVNTEDNRLLFAKVFKE